MGCGGSVRAEALPQFVEVGYADSARSASMCCPQGAVPARGLPRSEGRGKMFSRLAILPSKEIL